jgi:peptidoglycan/xylan/chitin deacetylase (PgdA/CDA1 family)
MLNVKNGLLILALSAAACQTKTANNEQRTANSQQPTANSEQPTATTQQAEPQTAKINLTADPATVLARQQVPILCYHQIRDWRGSDSKGAKDYIVPVENFKAQIKMLADSGYHSVLPDQLMAYLTTGAALPSKPVMFTFDDTDLDQYTVAAPELEKHGFKGVFFIMTVSIGRRGRQPYMDKTQIKDLADRGHQIAAHTWDHHNVKKYAGDDWRIQIEEPKQELEEITGKPIKYFAYPFGLWNPPAIPELKKRGMEAAFILAEKRDPQDPLHTIRRIIASGYWSPKTLYGSMVQSFKSKPL